MRRMIWSGASSQRTDESGLANFQAITGRLAEPVTARESEIFGLHYNVVYRNYEAQSLVNDIGRPLYALASGYEYFLYLEGRKARSVAVPAGTRAR